MAIRTTEEMYGSESGDKSAAETPRDAIVETAVTASVESKPVEKQVETKTETAPIAKPVEKTDDEDHDHVPESDDLLGLKKALAAERGDKRKHRKARQETERELAELKGKLAVFQQFGIKPQKQEPVAATAPQATKFDPTVLFDPEQAEKFLTERDAAIEKRIFLKMENEKLDRSEVTARAKHPDWQESWNVFEKACEQNPTLFEQMKRSDDPGEFVHKTAKDLNELKDVHSIDDLRAKIRAEVEAELKGSSAQGQQPSQNQQGSIPAPVKPVIPKSLASIRGSGFGTTPEWKGARTAEQMYNS